MNKNDEIVKPIYKIDDYKIKKAFVEIEQYEEDITLINKRLNKSDDDFLHYTVPKLDDLRIKVKQLQNTQYLLLFIVGLLCGILFFG